jgi:hypothetical protein
MTSGDRGRVLLVDDLPGEGRTPRLEAARRSLSWLEDHAGASSAKGPTP